MYIYIYVYIYIYIRRPTCSSSIYALLLFQKHKALIVTENDQYQCFFNIIFAALLAAST